MHYIRLLNCQRLRRHMEDATVVLWQEKKKTPLLFHVCFIVSFGGEWFLLLPGARRRKASSGFKSTKCLKGKQAGSGLMVQPLQREIKGSYTLQVSERLVLSKTLTNIIVVPEIII